ncbi:hypothetical protein MVEN_00644800 [Mycena venus]|uniref:Uncharacterized protein n=1 Tax=Mycena venus TaxID=2733690 RepID=A0A8H7D8N4_9AGAR|nr:hypothetical protein MVEN_00644800 [Mycena venus]
MHRAEGSMGTAPSNCTPIQIPIPAFLTMGVSQHLHVQPGSDITVHNLVDLGLQSGTSTDFTVTLPIGQNFTFAYNTIADQFTVFLSSLMQVGPGTTDCLPGSEGSTTSPPPPLPPTTSPTTSPTKAPPTTSTNDAPPTTTSKSPSITHDSTSSASTPSSTVSGPSSQAADFEPSSTSASQGIVPVATASAGSSKAAAAFPVGPVVGSVCALAVVILIALAIFLWYWNRRSKRILAYLNPQREREHDQRAPATSTMTLNSEMAQHAPLTLPMRGDIPPYQESFAPQEHPNLRPFHSASNSVSGSTEPSTTTAQEHEHEQSAPATSAMTMHSEMAEQAPLPLPMHWDTTPYQENFAPVEHPKMRDFYSESNSVSRSTEPNTTTAQEERGRRGYLSGASEELPPAYDNPPASLIGQRDGNLLL